MHNVVKVWLIGCLAIAVTAANTVFNGILAVDNTSNPRLNQVLRILLFIGLGFSFLDVLVLLYFTAFYVRNVKSHTLHLKQSIWSVLGLGVVTGFVAVALPLLTLVWLTIDRAQLPTQSLGHGPMFWLAIWFACWGATVLVQLVLFLILGSWTSHQIKHQSAGRLDIDFGTRLPPTPPEVMRERHRSDSRNTTIVELPRTPPAKRPTSSSQYSVSTKAPTLSKARISGPNMSAKSSLDMAYPAGEAKNIDNAFDRWDTSSVHEEMRAAVGSSPIIRSGLETIPGSRPESPEDAVDGPVLPSSPQVAPSIQGRSSSPQAITSDTATVLGDWSSSPSRQITTSSPPSSPPNFSRPTSKHKNQAMTANLEPSMQETIHPLFRSSSPHPPPPIITAGTMVTASPLANQPITPRTLATLRNHNKSTSAVNVQNPKPTGHWRAMPSLSQTSERRPSTAGSIGPSSPPPGSPGPSIVDEEELPPILPGFVLSAGQRSSMVGYANRKSVKRDRRGSQMSAGGS